MKIRPGISVLLVIALLAVAFVAGCAKPAETGKIAPPIVPTSLDLSSPERSVRTYLAFTNLSYRMVNSELATPAMTPAEGVRVDSYIELNREKGQGIEQTVKSLKSATVSMEGTGAVVSTQERWEYRYFSLATQLYTTPAYAASYDTTYTLVLVPRGWLVDKVQALAVGKVQ